MTNLKDIIIIGGGPGGYVSAIRASQLGLNVTLIENKELGEIKSFNFSMFSSQVFKKTKVKQPKRK